MRGLVSKRAPRREGGLRWNGDCSHPKRGDRMNFLKLRLTAVGILSIAICTMGELAQAAPDSKKAPHADAKSGARDLAPAPSVEGNPERRAPEPQDKAPGAASSNPFEAQTAELWRCRYTVAASRRKTPASVRVGKLALRFSVDTKGVATDPVVVALEPADPDVLVCIKREIERWRLIPAPPAPVPVDLEVSLDLRDVATK